MVFAQQTFLYYWYIWAANVPRETYLKMIEVNECPICESHTFSDYMDVTDNSISKEDFKIIQCASCGLRITSPRPEDNDLARYYESEDYISHSDTNKGFINFLYQKVKSITLRKKERLLSSLKTKKSILDIGCGTGDFIIYCKNKGWEVSGLEPDTNARNRALEKGLNNVKDIQELFSLPSNEFGIISMWHVLEHVSNLNEYMKQLHAILDKDGRLIIAVPNPDSPDAKKYKEHWAALDVPRHLFHFSKNNINDLAAKHSFKVENVLPMVFDSFYVSMLSEKYKKGSVLNAGINGLLSNVKASASTNHSSLIYILSKKA